MLHPIRIKWNIFGEVPVIMPIFTKGVYQLSFIGDAVEVPGLSTTNPQPVTKPTQLFLKTSLWNETPYMLPLPLCPFQGHTLFLLLKTKCHFSSILHKQKKWSLLIFEIQFPMPLSLCLFKTNRNGKWTLKIKWITLDLSIKEPFHWFQTRIMVIAIH